MKPLLLLCLLLAGCSLGGPRVAVEIPECGYVDASGRLYVPCERCTKKEPCSAFTITGALTACSISPSDYSEGARP